MRIAVTISSVSRFVNFGSINEVWEQIKVHLNVAGADTIRDQDVLTWFLDPDVQFPNPTGATNLEPLMVNTAGSLRYRPEAFTEVPNLFLASDYVKTYTDVACMEAQMKRRAERSTQFLIASHRVRDELLFGH